MLRYTTDRTWFSCLVRYLVRKWSRSILTTSEHTLGDTFGKENFLWGWTPPNSCQHDPGKVANFIYSLHMFKSFNRDGLKAVLSRQRPPRVKAYALRTPSLPISAMIICWREWNFIQINSAAAATSHRRFTASWWYLPADLDWYIFSLL